jgi:hypothetical protein
VVSVHAPLLRESSILPIPVDLFDIFMTASWFAITLFSDDVRYLVHPVILAHNKITIYIKASWGGIVRRVFGFFSVEVLEMTLLNV